jgi:hypothetical protein
MRKKNVPEQFVRMKVRDKRVVEEANKKMLNEKAKEESEA